ncbi:arsenic resistance protein [Microcella sp.]|uniref:arsenic resistance protein n=1 Tax=Microcella sp. TaxID=1913979 RepID=UPI00391D1632
MNREQLERNQVLVYLVAVVAGIALGSLAPAVGEWAEAAILPVLAVLLLATFLQVPLAHLPAAFRDVRFLGAVLIANFVLIPLVVAGLLLLAPNDPAIRLGIVMVLVVPCTDWFLTFTHVAKGDTARAVAATPVLLLVQLALLPVYVFVLQGGDQRVEIELGPIVVTFVVLIVIPLVIAAVLELLGSRRPGPAATAVEASAWLPVPLLAIVLFLIATSQVGAILGALPLLPWLTTIFVGYLVAAVIIALVTSRLLRLEPQVTRTVVFSTSTRNSFVVLPIALALPEAAAIAVVVIVVQTFVELFGMVIAVKVVPKIVPVPPPGLTSSR